MSLDEILFERIISTPVDNIRTLPEMIRQIEPESFEKFSMKENEWTEEFQRLFYKTHPKLRTVEVIQNDNTLLIKPVWIPNGNKQEQVIKMVRVLLTKSLHDYFVRSKDNYANDLFELISAWSWYGQCKEFFLNPTSGQNGDGGLDFGIRIYTDLTGDLIFWGDAKNKNRPMDKTTLAALNSRFNTWVNGDGDSEIWLKERLVEISPDFYNLSRQTRTSRLLICNLGGFNNSSARYARENHVKIEDGPETIARFLEGLLSDEGYQRDLSSYVGVEDYYVDIDGLLHWIDGLRKQTRIAGSERHDEILSNTLEN